MPPSVGQIVHYTPPGGEDDACKAAVITFICHDGNVALQVFWPPLVQQVSPDALASVPECPVSVPQGHTWHWPEHVPGARPPRF